MARKAIWSSLVLLLVLFVGAACEPLEENAPTRDAQENGAGSASSIQPTAVPGPLVGPTPPQVLQTRVSLPPPLPTPEPTFTSVDLAVESWQRIGGEGAAVELSVPNSWANLSSRMNLVSAANRLGIIALLAADTSKTGDNILAGKDLKTGAFVTVILSHQDGQAGDPVDMLTQVVANLEAVVAPIHEPRPLTIPVSQALPATTDSRELSGAYVDVDGDPIGFIEQSSALRTRILVLPSTAGNGSPNSNFQVLMLQSAPADQWPLYERVFSLMLDNLLLHGTVYGFTINDGRANVVGELNETGLVNGRLEREIKDIWVFDSGGGSFATISLSPADRGIDLQMNVVGPLGKIITTVDNGYAGDSELAADLYLGDSGRYFVEVGEFQGESGRYALSLVLSNGSRPSDQGRIEPGQGIRNELLGNAKHIWKFNGRAGEQVSIVLTPGDDQLDAILYLYDPEGSQLVALDEGFSGDAEVIAGFELAVTGEYSILVRSFAGNGGVYTISLDEGGEDTDNFYDAGDLENGSTRKEALRIDEAHAWFFDGEAGDSVSIEVIPMAVELDLDVWLLDPDLAKMVAQDKFAAGETETIEAILPRDGQYLVLVRDYFGRTGEYQITFNSVLKSIPQEAGRLGYGQVVTSTIQPGHSLAWHFWGEVDDDIDLRVTPLNGENDLQFVLQDPTGNTILQVDAALAGESEEVTGFTISSQGLWSIVVKDFHGDGGSFRLTVNRNPR